MPIVSLSLTENILSQMDRVRDEMGFSGRSDAVRAGIRLLVAEHEQRKALKGTIDATLVVVHEEGASDDVARVRHEHRKVIRTQLHDHLDSHMCVEIFMLRGDAREVRGLAQELSAAKGVARASLQVL